jgi:hypothetical protein
MMIPFRAPWLRPNMLRGVAVCGAKILALTLALILEDHWNEDIAHEMGNP